MIFRIFFLFILTISNFSIANAKDKELFNAKGFAYIYSNPDYIKKIVSKKFNSEELIISHPKLKYKSRIVISNPVNNKSLVLIIKKKSKYPKFYKILITPAVAKKLELDLDFPFVELQQIKKNKSFIAKKAVTHTEESNVNLKAPVTKIKIKNITKSKITSPSKKKNFSILIATFYSKNSAVLLKERLSSDLTNSSIKLLKIHKKSNNSYELLMGTYNSINDLKNDYNTLTNLNFEELDIKLND